MAAKLKVSGKAKVIPIRTGPAWLEWLSAVQELVAKKDAEGFEVESGRYAKHGKTAIGFYTANFWQSIPGILVSSAEGTKDGFFVHIAVPDQWSLTNVKAAVDSLSDLYHASRKLREMSVG